jgi:hypothetical protein
MIYTFHEYCKNDMFSYRLIVCIVGATASLVEPSVRTFFGLQIRRSEDVIPVSSLQHDVVVT